MSALQKSLCTASEEESGLGEGDSMEELKRVDMVEDLIQTVERNAAVSTVWSFYIYLRDVGEWLDTARVFFLRQRHPNGGQILISSNYFIYNADWLQC